MIATIPADTECYARPTLHDRAGLGLTLLMVASLALPASARGQEAFPYRYRTGWDVGIIATGAALFATDILISKKVDPLTPEQIQALDPSMVNSFDRIATRNYSTSSRTVSDVLLYATLAAPFTLMLTSEAKEDPLLIGLMYGEAQLLQGGLTFMLKSMVTRTRPLVYNDDPEIPLEKKMTMYARRSFPSAHTSTAFTSAVFLGSVYATLNPGSDAIPWIWAGGLTAASVVGYSRIHGGQHFPTDVLAGAAIGALAGWIVPALHKQEKTEGAAETRIAIPLVGLRF